MGVEPFLLSSSLIGVLAQRLVRKLCVHCRKLGAMGRYHPVGCEHCAMTGYKGRTGVYELMMVDDKIQAWAPIHARVARGRDLRRRRGDRPALDARRRGAARPAEGHQVARRSDPRHPR